MDHTETDARPSSPMPGPRLLRSGLTLIELIIVVAIIGLLAATAIPLYIAYVTDSKRSEAKQNLKQIADGALTYFQEEHSSAATVDTRVYPAGSACSAGPDPDGGRMSPTSTDWEKRVWQELRFAVSKPHYYQYCYQAKGDRTTFSATADAVLGGGGVVDSRFCLQGTSEPQALGPVEINPAASCAPP